MFAFGGAFYLEKKSGLTQWIIRTSQPYRELTIIEYCNGTLLEGFGWTHRLRAAQRLFPSVLVCDTHLLPALFGESAES